MPRKHANMSVSRTLPAKYLTAKSPLCRFRTNMPLKHANMGVSRAAARSPLNTWQPSHIYAGLEQTCHLNMPTWATCRDWIAKRNGITHNGYINCSSKTGSRPPSGKTTILKRFLKANLKAPFATNEKICCQSTIRNFHAAIAMQITTLCKTQKYHARTRSSEEPWHSHSTAICADGLSQHIRIATHDCRTHRFDAPVPMHKVSQHMQNTIAQQQQRREKVTRNPHLAIPMRSANNDPQNTIRIVTSLLYSILLFSTLLYSYLYSSLP